MTELTLNRNGSWFDRLTDFVRCELAPFPGRTEAMGRAVLTCAIVILTSMTLQVPFLALSLIMVFFTGQENTFLTRKSGIGLIIGTTIAVTLSLLIMVFTMGYPLGRIACASVVCFVGMYFMRISKLGTIGYLVALFVVFMQSLVDIIDQPEALTRSILWVWVAITYPVVVTIIVNMVMRPAHPHRLLVREALRQLDVVGAQLRMRLEGTTIAPMRLNVPERGFIALHRHLVFATMSDNRYAADKPRFMLRVTTIDRLHAAAAQLSHLPALDTTPEQRQLLQCLTKAVQGMETAVDAMTPFAFGSELAAQHPVHGEFDALLHEMAHALNALTEAETQPKPAGPSVAEPSVVSDAFSNPVYAQFALKTLCATMLCYVFYTAVQWPGIHTAMLTCIIMALPSLGATTHKGLLRIVGCALGAIVTLWATVFIIPELESITGLLMLTLPVIAVGAWVAVGSPSSSYIGVQFVFAYALSLLGHFGPTTELTEIRDRVVGIVLGVVVSLVVYSLLWPEREGSELRQNLARLIDSIAGLLRAEAAAMQPADMDRARAASLSLLARNRELQSRVALEPTWLSERDTATTQAQTFLADAQETLFALNRAQTMMLHAEPHLPRAVMESVQAYRAAIIQRLDAIAKRLRNQPVSLDGQAVADTASELRQRCEAVDNALAPELRRDLPAAADILHERVSHLATLLERTAS